MSLNKNENNNNDKNDENNNEESVPQTPQSLFLTEKAKTLLSKEERTADEERELEEELFGKSTMSYEDQFKFHKFESLNVVKNFPYKEWLGETANDETVVVRYHKGELWIGAGRSEIKARENMLKAGITKDNKDRIVTNHLTLEKMNRDLKLEWVLPSGYVEE